MTVDKQLFDEFIKDFNILLAPLTDYLLKLDEKDASGEGDLVERIFRAYHSIKGGTALLGMEKSRSLSSAMSDVLAGIRDGEIKPEKGVIDSLLKGTDLLRISINGEDGLSENDLEKGLKALKKIRDNEGEEVSGEEDARMGISSFDGGGGGVSLTLADFDVSPERLSELRNRYDYLYILRYNFDDFTENGGKSLEDIADKLSRGGEIAASKFENHTPPATTDQPSIFFDVLWATMLEPEYADAMTGLLRERIVVTENPEALFSDDQWRKMVGRFAKRTEDTNSADASETSRPSKVAENEASPANPSNEAREIKNEKTALEQGVYGELMFRLDELNTLTSGAINLSDEEAEKKYRQIIGKLENTMENIRANLTLKHDAQGVETMHFSTPHGFYSSGALFNPSARTEPIRKRIIYLLEKDTGLAGLITDQINTLGFEVAGIGRLTDLVPLFNQENPSAVIIDIDGIEDSEDWERIRPYFGVQPNPTPLLVISGNDELMTRVKMVRAGAKAFMQKPLDLVGLIEQIDRLTDLTTEEPYKILVVDDQAPMAEYHAHILKKCGMEVRCVTDPLMVVEVLSEFSPDLVLMDVYMPQCTGVEIADVIRQKEEFVSIPIVYLSSESDIEKQLYALSIGADDFLTKPIKPAHLISSVNSKAKRYRKLRSLMERDGMTGLLNHTNITERLQNEIQRAVRYDEIFCFAMLDIDKFKSINDKYGHPTGDRVIKALARLLKQRLRGSDVVGRYGGEEFSIILVNTDEKTSIKVIDILRHSFSQIVFQFGEEEFYVTFSAGVAEFNKELDAKTIVDLADKALYEAKRGGRNRVVAASQISLNGAAE